MTLSENHILLISPEPWTNMYVSKHHYAVHLAKMGNTIYFLNPPSNNYSKKKINSHLWVVDYKPKFRGLQMLPEWLNSRLIGSEIKELEKKIGEHFGLIWNFDPSRFFNLSKIKAYKICHIVDWNQHFQRNKLATTADICFSTSCHLKDELAKYNANSHLINHGYSFVETSPIKIPEEHSKKKVGYVGNLNIKYLDWSLINQIVKTQPLTSFFFIGPYDLLTASEDMKKVHSKPNSYFTGKVAANLIPSYLEKMDLLIITYLSDEFPIQLANPHKMLEYLGSGKPIVSTFTNHYKNCDLIYMSNKNSDFPSLFLKILYSLDKYSTIELSERRINFALGHSYEKQIARIEDLL